MFKGRFLVELSWRVLGAGVSPGGHQVLIFPRNCPGTVLLVCDRERQPRALRSDECSSHGDTGVLVVLVTRGPVWQSVVRGLSVVSDVHQTIRPIAALWSCEAWPRFSLLDSVRPILGLSWTEFSGLNYPNNFWRTWQLSPTQISPRSWTQRKSGHSKVHRSWRSSRENLRLIRF